MYRLHTLIAVFVIVLFFSITPEAQTSFISDIVISPKITSEKTISNAFYKDEHSQTLYIDFESVTVNLYDIIVINEKDEITYSDRLSNLPVNTIYELDYSQFRPGHYTIELRSYTESLTTEVKVK